MTESAGGRMARYGYRMARFGPVRQVRSWFKHKSRNDQRAILALLTFFIALSLYAFVWMPSRAALANATSYYENRRDLYQWVKGNEEEIRQLLGQRGGNSKEALGGRSLLTVVTDTAKKQGLALKRFEPKGDTAVNLWLEGAAFNELVIWLDQLREQYEVRIDQISVDRDPQQPGLVSVKLQLSI